MHFNKKNIPNCITSVRIVGAVILFFVEPFSFLFYLIYSLCGVTDVLDGFAARKLHAVSEFGSMLDSISDLLFYAAMLRHVIPYLWGNVPVGIWYYGGAVIGIRVISYLLAGIKFRRFAALHTYGNKVSGAVVFAVPYLLLVLSDTTVCIIACTVTMLATVEEFLLHLTSGTYDPKRKTIFMHREK